MKTRNNVLVMDTETIGTFGKPIVHDWGWKVVDRDFNGLTEKRFLVKEFHIEQPWMLKTSDFYGSKADLYKKAIEENSVEIRPWKAIVAEFLADIKNYKVNCISAYNLAFDYKALKYTDQFFNYGNTKLIDTLDKKYLLCIWNLACETVLADAKYHEYAKMKDFISEAGNYFTSAEKCYAYLIDCAEYTEEHTALEDVKIEVEILEYILKNCKGKVQYGLFYSCWQKAQK